MLDAASLSVISGAPDESTADSGSGNLQLPVFAEAPPRQPGLLMPIVVLSARDLRRGGGRLTPGAPVVVEGPDGRRTVAVCEAGGRDGGVLIAPSVSRSVGARVGNVVTLTGEFGALDACEVDIEVPAELHAAWPALMGGLRLEPYLAAVLEGALLTPGDERAISVNGRPRNIRIVGCRGAECTTVPTSAVCMRVEGNSEFVGATGGEDAVVGPSGPWLFSRRTLLRVTHADLAVAGSAAGNGAEGVAHSLPLGGFSQVGGLRAVVDELREAVQLPLERPDLYRRLGVGPPRGVLLYGPPGTGKTLLARSLAEELRCPVELCAATDFVGSGLGESEERIGTIFQKCQRQAEDRGTGALLFIDEIDAVCPKRDDSSEAERRMVAAFLTALDGVRGNDGVIVLGATNRPDAIDPALRRAGRLEREIEVGVPNTEERLQILEVHLTGVKHALSATDRRELARRCHGYVGADLRALCMGAARAALRKGLDAIDLGSCLVAARVVPPSALKELLVEIPEVRWDDIGGYADTKQALKEAVEWPIRHAWAFEAMRIEPPRGVLLYGPPGCSKTMMAKAVATETEMNFVSIKGPELFSKYVGDSERAVRDVFRKARTAAPCVVFFDEIDAVGASREGEGTGGVASRVLAQLLAEMDGVGGAAQRRHVVVLAATNRPHVLDPALLRPGRFDRLVHVPLPDEPARVAIFSRQLARMHVGEGVDAASLAARSPGRSGAEVVMVCREAALSAIREALGREEEEEEEEVADVEAADGADRAMRHPPPCCASPTHFDRALAAVRPRIDADTLRLYEDFERRMRHS